MDIKKTTTLDEVGFDVQIIAEGSFVDKPYMDDKNRVVQMEVETAVIRLNHIALNEWHRLPRFNKRTFFDTFDATQEDWEAYQAGCKAKLDAWEDKILDTLGIDRSAKGGVHISQSISEIFTVICQTKMAAAR